MSVVSTIASDAAEARHLRETCIVAAMLLVPSWAARHRAALVPWLIDDADRRAIYAVALRAIDAGEDPVDAIRPLLASGFGYAVEAELREALAMGDLGDPRLGELADDALVVIGRQHATEDLRERLAGALAAVAGEVEEAAA